MHFLFFLSYLHNSPNFVSFAQVIALTYYVYVVHEPLKRF